MEFCGRCGAKVSDDQLFCHKCGASLAEQRALSDDTPTEAPAATYTASTPAWTPSASAAPPLPTPALAFTGFKGCVELYPTYLRIVRTGFSGRRFPNRGVIDIPLAELTDLALTPPGMFTMGYLTAIPRAGHAIPRTAQAAISDYLSLPYVHQHRPKAQEFAGHVSMALRNTGPGPGSAPFLSAPLVVTVSGGRGTTTTAKDRSHGALWFAGVIGVLFVLLIAAANAGGSSSAGTSTTGSGPDATSIPAVGGATTATDAPAPTDVPTPSVSNWVQGASRDTYADVRDHPDAHMGDKVAWPCAIQGCDYHWNRIVR